MRLRPHRRNLVLFSSSVPPAGRYDAPRYRGLARTGRIHRLIRISVLFTVIAVRPRWRQLLAGTALTVLGLVSRDSVGGGAIIPGFLLLYAALLTPGDPDADRERRAQLRRELAAYSTPAQRCDLEATLDRYPDGITYEMRDILASQSGASRESGIPGGTSRAGI